MTASDSRAKCNAVGPRVDRGVRPRWWQNYCMALQSLPSHRQEATRSLVSSNVVIQDLPMFCDGVPLTRLVYAVFPTTVVW
jgi:hypothetical protein